MSARGRKLSQLDILTEVDYLYGYSGTTPGRIAPDNVGGGGSGAISSGSITAQQYFDITIPSTGDGFRLLLSGVDQSVAKHVCGAFSYSGTFVNDLINGDSYVAGFELLDFSGANVSGGDILFDGIYILLPGSGVGKDTARVMGIIKGQGLSGMVRDQVRPNATVPPPASRPTALRILPYGNGDANPPTSGVTITAGWKLLPL